jgi:hypothetical protein
MPLDHVEFLDHNPSVGQIDGKNLSGLPAFLPGDHHHGIALTNFAFSGS